MLRPGPTHQAATSTTTREIRCRTGPCPGLKQRHATTARPPDNGACGCSRSRCRCSKIKVYNCPTSSGADRRWAAVHIHVGALTRVAGEKGEVAEVGVVGLEGRYGAPECNFYSRENSNRAGYSHPGCEVSGHQMPGMILRRTRRRYARYSLLLASRRSSASARPPLHRVPITRMAALRRDRLCSR